MYRKIMYRPVQSMVGGGKGEKVRISNKRLTHDVASVSPKKDVL